MTQKTILIVFLLGIIGILSGCNSEEIGEPDSQLACQSDNDCQIYCCSSCANSAWIEKNINPNEECCYMPPGGFPTGCQCINNKCETAFE